MKKQFLTLTLCALCALSLSAQTFSGGSGNSASDPYLISSKADMEALAAAVNGGNNYSGKYFLLTQDITEAVTTVIGTASNNPTPRYFRGIFDGSEHTVTVNITAAFDADGGVGVFGSLYNATIQNLKVAGSITSSLSLSETTGRRDRYSVGGVCGRSSNSSIINCHSSVDISTFGTQNTGGICGDVYNGIISHCSNTGNLSSQEGFAEIVAGITGYTYSSATIINCYNIGCILVDNSMGASRASGICGDALNANLKIINCYNAGNISAITRTAGAAIASGICNYERTSGSVLISNCFSANTIITCIAGQGVFNGTKITNRITSDAPDVQVVNCYALSSMLLNGSPVSSTDATSLHGADEEFSSFQSQTWINTNLPDWDFDDVWVMSDISSIYKGLPIFKNQRKYTVSFNSQGGSAVAPITNVNYGASVSEPVPAPTKSGYTFGGWFTDAACTTAWNFATAVVQDITLYAKWIIKPATSILVSDIIKYPTAMRVGDSPLTLTGITVPSGGIIEWELVNTGTTNATLAGNQLTVTAGGWVTINAIVRDGKGSGRDFVKTFVVTVQK